MIQVLMSVSLLENVCQYLKIHEILKIVSLNQSILNNVENNITEFKVNKFQIIQFTSKNKSFIIKSKKCYLIPGCKIRENNLFFYSKDTDYFMGSGDKLITTMKHFLNHERKPSIKRYFQKKSNTLLRSNGNNKLVVVKQVSFFDYYFIDYEVRSTEFYHGINDNKLGHHISNLIKEKDKIHFMNDNKTNSLKLFLKDRNIVMINYYLIRIVHTIFFMLILGMIFIIITNEFIETKH